MITNSKLKTKTKNQENHKNQEKAGKFLVIDTELTGFHPRENGLIEIAMMALDKNLNTIASWKTDVKPPKNTKIDPISLKISGFTVERINKGISYKEMCKQFLIFLENNFSQKPIVIAQFYPMDYSFLEDVFFQCGYKNYLAKEVLGNQFIDTKSLAITINLICTMETRDPIFRSTSLSYPGGLKDVLEVSGFESHTALGDCMATVEILKKMVKILKLDLNKKS